jgi:transcriptional regulator GlxA family with amidase domain
LKEVTGPRSGFLALAAVAVTLWAGLGFVDRAHFIRHFKRIMRMTPGQYARSAFGRTAGAAPGATASRAV